MTDAHNLPDAIQWHEGMLLAPQHFQQMSLRQEEMLHYHVMTVNPFHWGIRHIKIDQALLVEGTLRIMEMEAIMPDGLVVAHGISREGDLEVDLTPYADEMKQRPVTVHLAVPAKKLGLPVTRGDLIRYDSVKGRPVVDENTGESEMSIPRLRPRLSLLVTETPPQKYTSFPLFRVAYQNETFALTDYVPPSMTVSPRSPIGEMCASISHRMREKAVFLSERVRSPSSVMKGPMLLTTKSMIRSLVSALPFYEAVLNTGVAHPYGLYLSLCAVVGQVASLGRGLVPPVLAPYDHNDLFATFNQARDFIFRMIDEGILETHTPIPFDFENGVFSLHLEEAWVTRNLVIGVKARHGTTEKDVMSWIGESLIGSSGRIESMKDKRILGAARTRVEGDEDLVPITGVVLFSVKAEPDFIQPDELLEIFNTSDPAGKRSPAEVVLYVKNVTS